MGYRVHPSGPAADVRSDLPLSDGSYTAESIAPERIDKLRASETVAPPLRLIRPG